MTTTDTRYALRLEARDSYPEIGPAVLVRVDSRLVRCGYIHTYAPVTVGGVADRSADFVDAWDEVEAL